VSAALGRIDQVVVDCADPGRLARFRAGVLGGEPRQRDPDWHTLDPPGWTRLAFQRVPEPTGGKNRLHLDVAVDDLAAATEAADRLGARRVGDQHAGTAGSFPVLHDPEGNESCTVRPA
jgi:hypothetical protein